jgi:CheY-like chemotaxis protein
MWCSTRLPAAEQPVWLRVPVAGISSDMRNIPPTSGSQSSGSRIWQRNDHPPPQRRALAFYGSSSYLAQPKSPTVFMENSSKILKHRILIVDDEPAWLDVVSMMLESKGYHVKAVRTGTDALAALTQFKPDLILSDVRMPDMNGFDFLELAKKNPLSSSTPVVFLSAIDDFHARKIARDLGAADYITKPVDEQDVFLALQKYLPR